MIALRMLLPIALAGASLVRAADSDTWARAAANGRVAAEGFERCERYLHAWMKAAEPTTLLIPRNLTDSPYWNGRDSAADNYPFMVLSAAFTDRAAFDGPMRRMLENEAKLTVRPATRNGMRIQKDRTRGRNLMALLRSWRIDPLGPQP